MELVLITKDDFLKSDFQELFSNNEEKNNFGYLTYNKCKFKISWHSQLVQPKIKKISAEKYGIGIDQNFVIINFKNCKICKFLNLDYFFYEVKIYNDLIFIITEMEIIVLDNQFELFKKLELPDIFNSLNFQNDYMVVECMNGEEYKYDY